METYRHTAYASVAHRYRVGQLIGSNIRLEAAAQSAPPGPPPEFAGEVARIKALVDHQCLFTQIERFKTRPSTAETMVEYLGAELFARPLPGGAWVSLTLWETEETGCSCFPSGELELHLKRLNLTLNFRGPLSDEGFIAGRDAADRAVRSAFARFEEKSFASPKAWGAGLFAELKQSLPQLQSVAVDLGRHEYLLIPEPV